MRRPGTGWTAASVLTVSLLAATTASCGGGKDATPIPQPEIEGLAVAADSARLDLTLPGFSKPTEITNRLFPVSTQESVLFLGEVDGEPFRTEVTLLPYTRIVQWNGIQIEAAVSQYVAYRDGRIEEVALDLYAQADDGSVWYLGEDVSDFADGVIHTKEGTWIAGIEGPPAMIMPADPKVGDAYRTENWPGIAFEEVTVRTLNETLDGPFGAVQGGMVASELHADGTTEDKQFGPGYGEFYTGDTDGNYEALALAVPTDKASGTMPAELDTLATSAMALHDAANLGDWKAADTALAEMETAVAALPDTVVPKLVEPVLTANMNRLSSVVAERNGGATQQAAIEIARSSYDIQLRYRPATEIDMARLDLWAAQLQLDATDNDTGSVKGDTFTMILIKDRFIRSLDAPTVQELNLAFGDLQPAAANEELPTAADAAGSIRTLLVGWSESARWGCSRSGSGAGKLVV